MQLISFPPDTEPERPGQPADLAPPERTQPPSRDLGRPAPEHSSATAVRRWTVVTTQPMLPRAA